MKVGTVRQIARYPVKSLRGEALDQVPATLQGLEEDRRYAFVQADSRSAFPWFTARERARTLLYGTRVERAGLPDSAVKVTSPGGSERPIDSPELLAEFEELWGRRLYLMRDHRGCYDAAPVSLISFRTIERIAEESGTAPDPWRFRPNLLVDLPDGDEADWELRAFFANQHGAMVEDPVTGSFNAGVALHLFATGLARGSYRAAQGRRTGADGLVECDQAADGRVWIGGSCATIADGAHLADWRECVS